MKKWIALMLVSILLIGIAAALVRPWVPIPTL